MIYLQVGAVLLELHARLVLLLHVLELPLFERPNIACTDGLQERRKHLGMTPFRRNRRPHCGLGRLMQQNPQMVLARQPGCGRIPQIRPNRRYTLWLF